MYSLLLNEHAYSTMFNLITQLVGPIRQPGSILEPSVLPMPIIQSVQLHFEGIDHLLDNNLSAGAQLVKTIGLSASHACSTPTSINYCLCRSRRTNALASGDGTSEEYISGPVCKIQLSCCWLNEGSRFIHPSVATGGVACGLARKKVFRTLILKLCNPASNNFKLSRPGHSHCNC